MRSSCVPRLWRLACPFAVSLLLLLGSGSGMAASAAGTHVRFDGGDWSGSPFPNDRYTVRDVRQHSLRRVQLPKPDCTVRPSDCEDIDVLNTLDGFSTQPRITLPFSGPIDLSSVRSDTIWLLNLGDTRTRQGFGQRVGINQTVWDPATNTLALQPDALLNEHSRYALLVTNGVRDARGVPLQASPRFETDLVHGEERHGLREVLRMHHGSAPVVAVSLFTTLSSTTDLRKVLRARQRDPVSPVDFMIGHSATGPVRTVFALADLGAVQWHRQIGTAPVFADSALPLRALEVVPSAVGRVAWGRFTAPNYETTGQYIRSDGQPQQQGHHDLIVQIFLPAGTPPAAGWPVAIFGHGFGDSVYGGPWTVASVFASHGLATLAIQVVGHGGGNLGMLEVQPRVGETVTLPAGGRGIDQDGNGRIDATEGVSAAAPRSLIGSRDGLRQTTIDLMQLVRQVQAGIDVDGDGLIDLDVRRIGYTGQSFGGIYGALLLAVEPGIQAGVLNVPGGSIVEVGRLGVFRDLTGAALAARVPSLINVSSPGGIAFDENLPLRDEPLRVDHVPGAQAIAQVLDRTQWAQMSGNPVSYAALIRHRPPAGQAAKPVLLQFARGDMTVPNPTTTAILRAGHLADRAVYFRNDLAYAANPAMPKNPHTFLSRIADPVAAPFAVAAQQQIAAFLTSGGDTVLDPDGAAPLFEMPIVPPLPEDLNFLP